MEVRVGDCPLRSVFLTGCHRCGTHACFIRNKRICNAARQQCGRRVGVKLEAQWLGFTPSTASVGKRPPSNREEAKALRVLNRHHQGRVTLGAVHQHSDRYQLPTCGATIRRDAHSREVM